MSSLELALITSTFRPAWSGEAKEGIKSASPETSMVEIQAARGATVRFEEILQG